MMRRLAYLIIHGNGLTKDATDAATGSPKLEASPLPDIWASGSKRGFPALKQLVLYPGNEYLCSIPNNDVNNLGYRDVNLGEEAASSLDRCAADPSFGHRVVLKRGGALSERAVVVALPSSQVLLLWATCVPVGSTGAACMVLAPGVHLGSTDVMHRSCYVPVALCRVSLQGAGRQRLAV